MLVTTSMNESPMAASYANPSATRSTLSLSSTHGRLHWNSSSITVADFQDLRRVKDKVPWRVWLVAVISFWERAAFWGIIAPWQNYMEHPIHHNSQQTPGALGLGQTMATRLYCAFSICYFITPMFAAPIADSYLGQYWMLVLSAVVYCCGCAALTVSSLPANLERGWGLPGLILAMVLIALGGGACKAIMATFIASQCPESKPQMRTLKSGERVITDYELTLQYIYSLYFWVGNVGGLSSFPTVYMERQYGFISAYGLCTGLMIVATLIILFGQRWFITAPPTANVLPHAFRIIACAIRRGCKLDRASPEYQLSHHQKTVPWTFTLVNELKRGLRACRVLLAFIPFYICFEQMQNNLISQAAQMKFGNKYNDVLPGINPIACIIIGPLVEECLYPYLHKRRIYISPITRIATGFCIVATSMLCATLIQHTIYSSSPCYDFPKNCARNLSLSELQVMSNRPNVWIQAPLYVLMATGEVFAMTTAMEFAYKYAPKDMKVVVQAINLLVAGVGSGIAMALAEVARDPWITYLFAGLTASMAVTAIAFWFLFSRSAEAHDSSARSSLHLEDTSRQAKNSEDVALRPLLCTPAAIRLREAAKEVEREGPGRDTQSSPRASGATL